MNAMTHNICIIKKAILWFFSILVCSSFGFLAIGTNDLLNQAFDQAKTYDYVVNPGNDKDSVGSQIFNPTTDVTIFGPNAGLNTKEPYLIRLTKLILRITIAISVSIILFAGISYITAFGDTGKQKKAQTMIIYALWWIFIWLASLAIVELALSITKSSIKF